MLAGTTLRPAGYCNAGLPANYEDNCDTAPPLPRARRVTQNLLADGEAVAARRRTRLPRRPASAKICSCTSLDPPIALRITHIAEALQPPEGAAGRCWGCLGALLRLSSRLRALVRHLSVPDP